MAITPSPKSLRALLLVSMDAVGKTPGVVVVHDRSPVVKAFQQAGKTKVAQAVVFGGG